MLIIITPVHDTSLMIGKHNGGEKDNPEKNPADPLKRINIRVNDRLCHPFISFT